MRYRFEKRGTRSFGDFITTHKGFADPEYILKDNVTLYYITETEAIFVETDPDMDITKTCNCGFMMINQFYHAKQLIILPIDVFHKLAANIGDPHGKLIFMGVTARCGSTLLTRCFDETGRIKCFSEPLAFKAIVGMEAPHLEDSATLLKCCSFVNILCKPDRSRIIDAYFFKLDIFSTIFLRHLSQLYSDAYLLFMYRDGLKV